MYHRIYGEKLAGVQKFPQNSTSGNLLSQTFVIFSTQKLHNLPTPFMVKEPKTMVKVQKPRHCWKCFL